MIPHKERAGANWEFHAGKVTETWQETPTFLPGKNKWPRNVRN
jgi:hypothetical protein